MRIATTAFLVLLTSALVWWSLSPQPSAQTLHQPMEVNTIAAMK